MIKRGKYKGNVVNDLRFIIMDKIAINNEIVSAGSAFLTRELRACARASCKYDVGDGTRSLARLVDSCKLYFDFRLLSEFDSFWRAINKRNGDLCC